MAKRKLKRYTDAMGGKGTPHPGEHGMMNTGSPEIHKKKRKKYTEAQDDAYDRRHGIKEGSKRDQALDRSRGLSEKKKRKAPKASPRTGAASRTGQVQTPSAAMKHKRKQIVSNKKKRGTLDNVGYQEKRKRKNWIQGAIKHPGALHRELGVPEGKKIPSGKLNAAANSGGKLGRRARLAQTLEGMHKKKSVVAMKRATKGTLVNGMRTAVR